MFLLAFRNLRARPGRTLFTAFAVALGVALVLAARMASLAGAEINRQSRADRVAGADLEVSYTARTNFGEYLLAQVAARPEVQAVAPLLRAPTPSGGLVVLGVDPAQPLRAYSLAAGVFLSAPEAAEVLLPLGWAARHGLGVGNTVALVLAGQAQTYTIVGLLKEESLPGSLPTAWLPIRTLQAALSAPNEVTAVLVQLRPGRFADRDREALQADLGPAYTVTSAQAGATAQNAYATLGDAALPFASLVVLLAGAFFIYNAFAITLAERAREIGQLRALGMTRGQAVRLTLTEALGVALLGVALGLPLGLGLGAAMTANAGVQVGAPLDGMLLAAGIGLTVTLGVVFQLARAGARVSPLQALAASPRVAPQPSVLRLWSFLSLACLLLFALAQWATLDYLQDPPTAALAFWPLLVPFLLGAAVLFALPLAVHGLLRLGERLTQRRSAAQRLAFSALARAPDRAALTALTLAIGLMLVVFMAGISENVIALFVDNFQSVFVDYDFVLYRVTASEEAAPPVSPELQVALAELSAAAEVISYASVIPGEGTVFGLTYPSQVYVAGVDFVRDAPLFQTVEGSWEEAEKYFAAGRAVAIPEIASRRLDLHPGDALTLETFEGPISFTVAVVTRSFFVLPPADGERYFHAYPGMWLVRLRPGGDHEAVRARVRTIAATHGLQSVEDLASFFSGFLTTFFGSLLALFGGLTSISGIVAGLGVANTLFASILERQRELGTLRALGFARAQVRGLVLTEAVVLGLLGSGLGVLGGVAMSLANLQIFTAQFALVGFAPLDRLTGPWGMAAFALIAGPTLATVAALWPADRAASVNPADAMRAEGATGFLKPAQHLGPTGLRGILARLPLAAKLSITTGLIIIVTVAALTAVRVNYERQLIEDNIRAIFARATELMVGSSESQLPPEVTELTPELVRAMMAQSDTSTESLNQLFQSGASRYDFSLKYAFITNTAYKVLSGSRAEYNNTTLTDTVALAGSASTVRLTDWIGERAFESTIAIDNQAGQRLGYAIVGISTDPVDHLTRDIVQSSLWMMAVALAVAVALTVFFTRRALAPLAQIADASHAVARGDLSQRIPETRWDEVGRMSRAFNEMVHGLNDRERMRDLFGRYLSREVSEAVLAGRVTLTGERKTITCLYVDMRGSTSFAEKHAPEEVMAALNEYFEVIILATEAHGGIVNRFVGDEAVCVFGAPRDYRDHADRALQAALAMRDGLAYLNSKREALNLPTLKFGMGLNSGEVVAGATGSEERQEYTVIGDAMNVGARIQALNKTFPDHDILLSEFTVKALKNEYALVDLGPVELRGKSESVRVFGVK